MLGISSIPIRLVFANLFSFQNNHLRNIHDISNIKFVIFQITYLGNIHGIGNTDLLYFQRTHLVDIRNFGNLKCL